jgi:hypothetical protein
MAAEGRDGGSLPAFPAVEGSGRRRRISPSVPHGGGEWKATEDLCRRIPHAGLRVSGCGREEQRCQEAHVADLAGEVLIEQDVGRLEVTMDNGVRPGAVEKRDGGATSQAMQMGSYTKSGVPFRPWWSMS